MLQDMPSPFSDGEKSILRSATPACQLTGLAKPPRLAMLRGKDALAAHAHGSETSSLDGHLLYAEWAGALTKQRKHVVPRARLDLGKPVIHLTQYLTAEDALQWAFHRGPSSLKALRGKVAPSPRRSKRLRGARDTCDAEWGCRDQGAGMSSARLHTQVGCALLALLSLCRF